MSEVDQELVQTLMDTCGYSREYAIERVQGAVGSFKRALEDQIKDGNDLIIIDAQTSLDQGEIQEGSDRRVMDVRVRGC